MLSGRLGIVGGVGPLAAAHFYQRIIQLADAERDEDHLAVVLVSERVPSRIEHLMGEGPSPLPALIKAVTALASLKVDAIAVPSATTHAYQDDLRSLTDRPVFDLLGSVAAELAESRLRRPMIFATRATVCLGLYDRCLPAGISPGYPDRSLQEEVDRVILGVKEGRALEPLRRRLTELAADALDPSCDCLVLGCTELSVVQISDVAGSPVIDASDVLALRVLRSYAESAPTGSD